MASLRGAEATGLSLGYGSARATNQLSLRVTGTGVINRSNGQVSHPTQGDANVDQSRAAVAAPSRLYCAMCRKRVHRASHCRARRR